MLATAANASLAYLWDTESWNSVATFRGHSRAIHGVGFSPDSRRLITSGFGREAIKLWDTTSHQEIITLGDEDSTIFQDPALLEDNRTLIVMGIKNGSPGLHVWRAPTWEEIKTAEAAKAQ